MEFVTEWVRNIIIFLLLATVLHMILPRSSMQKYVKFVVSLLLIVLILSPLFQLLKADVPELIDKLSRQPYGTDGEIENLIDKKKKEIQASQRAYILEQMAVQMKKEVAQKLQDEYGVTIANLHLVVPEDKQDVTSQQDVQSVSVTVSEEEPQRSGAVEAVKPIEVDTSTPYESRIDNDASQDIQKFLAQEWQLEKNKVQVYTEGGTGKANE
ncbi:stage III sporulation protein AF [Ectobacillus funiculus]|uniref:Stage III sporulation protein AF n=1 Tax=Ectobacillus funiculus TaxID=137993 RepID=A0ABV5WMK5_9BACI